MSPCILFTISVHVHCYHFSVPCKFTAELVCFIEEMLSVGDASHFPSSILTRKSRHKQRLSTQYYYMPARLQNVTKITGSECEFEDRIMVAAWQGRYLEKSKVVDRPEDGEGKKEGRETEKGKRKVRRR